MIKAFIMAAVFDKLVYTDGATEPSSDYESSLKSLLTQMITVSDNDAANELARRLGGGDFQKGASVLNEFCQEHLAIHRHISDGNFSLPTRPMTIIQVHPTAAVSCPTFTAEPW